MKAFILFTDGSQEERTELAGPISACFDKIAQVIGDTDGDGRKAYLERLTFTWGEMWIDEEGIVQNAQYNRTATYLAPGHTVLGCVVIRVKNGYAYSEGGPVLRVNSRGEPVSKYLAMNVKKLRAHCNERGIEVVDLNGRMYSKKSLIAMLRTYDASREAATPTPSLDVAGATEWLNPTAPPRRPA